LSLRAEAKEQTPKTDLKTIRNDERGIVMGNVMGDWKLKAGTPSTLCDSNREEGESQWVL
jgi:hypothetical protein